MLRQSPSHRHCAGSAIRLWSLVVLLVLSGCARDREADLRQHLNQWFHLGATVRFQSRPKCTAAIFELTTERTRPSLAVRSTMDSAVAALSDRGVVAIRRAGASPHQMAEALLARSTGAIGSEVLHASALAGPCLQSEATRRQFLEALTRQGGVLIYDAQSKGLAILDPVRLRLYFAAGDVW